MLVLQLFTGMEEISLLHTMDLNSQEAIDEYLENVLRHLNSDDGISEDGKQFLRDCLTYDKEERPTARHLLMNRWLQEPNIDNALFRQLETESVAPWIPRGVILPAIEDLWLDNAENARVESAESRAAPDEVSPHFGHLELEGISLIQGCEQEPSPEPTAVENAKYDVSPKEKGTTRGFMSLPHNILRPAVREAKLGSRRRLDILHAGRPKRQRLYSM
jgi:hypothetical protein